MSYWDWTGNKDGKSIYQTKIPIVFIFILLIILFIGAAIILSGCQTLDWMTCGDRGCAKHNWYGGCKECE